MSEPAASPRSRAWWIRTIAFWVLTIGVAQELLAGSMWDLLRIEFVRSIFRHIGYPSYVLLIIGSWKLAGGIVLLLPRLQRAKEWAYAGTFFMFSGACASHLLNGDGVNAEVIGTFAGALLTVGSWALRPASRRLPSAKPEPARPLTWIAPIAVAAVFLVAALLTLPKGPAPF